jgi:chemotaxis protein methyltransferase CheR
MIATIGTRSNLNGHEDGLREVSFTREDFAQTVGLLQQLTGMVIRERKRDLVYGRIMRRLRATGTASFSEYLDRVRSDEVEAEQFVNALTTNLTSFFREAHHFPVLADHALRAKPNGNLHVWCAASSTGEEPYSIAITLAQAYGTVPPPATILATDLDTNVLHTAREGVYDVERVKNVPPDVLKAFFLKGKGENAGRVRVSRAVRESVVFERMNLLGTQFPPKRRFDAIFLRNVLIYFKREDQREVLQRIAATLADDGILITGHSESLFYAGDLFKTVGSTVYCRRDSKLYG